MAIKSDLKQWVVEGLRDNHKRASVVDVCRHIWEHHEDELRRSGPFFFTWQYDVRWAAHALRREGVIRPADVSPRGVWELE